MGASIADEKEQIVNDLVPVVRKLGRERKKVEAGTLYMDTVVLHGQPQRFKTDELYQKLHWFYFYLLSQTIADRSELCVLERRLMHMQYILSQGTVVVKEKKVLVKKMRVEKARFDRMRLRKSILGKEQMFGKSQYRAISFAFNAWRAWWRGHVGTKRAFILKQGLIKHEYDLKRVGRERREAKRRKEHGMASHTDDDQGHPSWKDNVGDWRRIRREKRAALGLWNPKEDDSVVGGGGAVREEVPVSIMKRHQRRWLECKMCKIRYREGQNHQRACQYHSGVYKLACPKSCPFALTKPHSVKCLAHYRTRWSCCESLAEGEYGSTGCDYRWHATSGVDIPYRAQHEQHKEEMNQTSKYDVAGSEPKKKTKSTKERRREQLKKRNAERNRIKREMEEMIEEDVLGSAMQQDDMRKRQQEAMKDENMDSDGSDESSGNESDYDNLEEIESEDSDGSLWDSTDEDEEDDSTPLGTPLSRSLRYYDVSVREIKEQMRTDRRAARKI